MGKSINPDPADHLLTLKNLYRMLTHPDYPVHSYPVFPDKYLHGQTLTSFWYTLLRDGLPREIDLSLFDTSERRSRSLTKLLNSTGNAGFLGKWYDDLSARLNQELLTGLIQAWMDRLETWQYAPEALRFRLNTWLHSLTADDTLTRFFLDLAESLSADTDTSLLFRHGLLLTWLTLYALYGSRMQDVHLNRLRAETESRPLAELYRLYVYHRLARQPRVLSERQCALCVEPLPPGAFFGRTKELARAAEIMHAGGKLIVREIGGIGKTEFVRQLLSLLSRSRIWTRLAFVQYEGNLSVSLAQAFPELRDLPAQRRLSDARLLLEQQDGGKTLLLMDNLSETAAHDPDLASLASWGCDIIITTRQTPLEGFSVLTLGGLSKEDGAQLFYHHDTQAQGQKKDVAALCAHSQGHPLAITLFANLCSRRYWPVSKLLQLLDEHELSQLSYVHQASSLRLEDVFERTFSTSSLTESQIALMRLISLLPYQYWLPETLLRYAGDIHSDADALADSCQVLCDLGWLLSGPEGFAIHPLIAETVTLQHLRAEDFPRLCETLFEAATEEDELSHRVLVSCVLRLSELSLPLVRALARTEQLLGRASGVYLPEKLYTLHRRFLDAQPHEPADETDYWLALGIRDIVTFSTVEHLESYLEHILEMGRGSVRYRICLYTILEFAADGKHPEVVDRVFEMMRPEEDGEEMADYLISLSVRQREGLHDPAGAIASLRKAEALLDCMGERSSLRRSNLLYRWAVSELDLSRPEQARPLLEHCLKMMAENGRSDQTATVMSTRNTYAFTLTLLKEYDAALLEYGRLKELYRQQHRERSTGYSTLCNNMAVLLDQMGKYNEARDAITKALRIDETLSPSDAVCAVHLRTAGLVLAHCGAYREAAVHAEKAVVLRRAAFGADSPWTADAKVVLALSRAHLGPPRDALNEARSALEAMKASWGGDHRNIIAAERILAEIEALCV